MKYSSWRVFFFTFLISWHVIFNIYDTYVYVMMYIWFVSLYFFGSQGSQRISVNSSRGQSLSNNSNDDYGFLSHPPRVPFPTDTNIGSTGKKRKWKDIFHYLNLQNSQCRVGNIRGNQHNVCQRHKRHLKILRLHIFDLKLYK